MLPVSPLVQPVPPVRMPDVQYWRLLYPFQIPAVSSAPALIQAVPLLLLSALRRFSLPPLSGVPLPESEFTPKKRRKKPSPAVKEPEYKEAPAGKPDPAKATAAMPPENESLPLPFSDDMGIGDDEYGGAMTGGEGVYDIHDYGSYAAGGFIPPYRTAEELLTEPEDMTDKERKRLERIKAIPESVRELCQTEVANLRSQVMELEKRSDEIIDFLNGEAV